MYMTSKGDSDTKTLPQKNMAQILETALVCAFLFLVPVFFLPFTLDSVSFSKQILAGGVLLGLFIYILIRFLTAGRITLPPKYLSLGVLGLFLTVLVSAVFSKAPSVSFLGASPDSLFWVGMYVLAFVLTVIVLTNRRAVVFAFTAYIGGIVATAVFALLQFSGFGILPFDFARDINFNPVGSVFELGLVAAAGLAALLAYLANHRPSNPGMQAVLWAVAGVLAVLVVQINLFAIWICFSLTFIAIAIAQSHRLSQTQKGATPKLPMLPLFIVMAAILALFVFRAVPAFISVPAEVSPTFGATVDITKSSIEGTRMAYGTGPGTFPYNYSAHRSIEINQTDFWGVQFNQGYSAFLTYVSTWGLLGTIALLFLLALFMWKLFKGYLICVRQKSADPVLESIVLAMLASVIFLSLALFIRQGNPVLHIMLYTAAGIGLSALNGMGITQRMHLVLMRSPKIMFASSLATIALIGVALGTLYFLGINYTANIYAKQGIDSFNEEQDIDKALNKMNTATTIDPNDDLILRAASQAFIIKLNEVANNSELEQQEASKQAGAAAQGAITFAERATKINPLNGQNWIQLARVYEAIIGLTEGAEERALSAYSKSIELDPFNPSLPVSVARVHLAAADVLRANLNALAQTEGDVSREGELLAMREEHLNKAIESASRAIELKNNYSTARLVLASAYGRLGNLQKAIAEVREAISSNPNDPDLFFQLGLYQFESSNFGEANISFETAVRLAGGDFANARFYLGLSYDASGDKQKAIEQFEIVLKDNPDNELVQSIIENLKEGKPALEGLDQSGAEAPVSETQNAEELF